MRKYATVKDTEGRTYELRPTRLHQPAQRGDFEGGVVRWVSRSDIGRSYASTTLHNDWSDEFQSEYFDAEYDIILDVDGSGNLNVGCRKFNKSATKKILDWAKTRKPAKKAKRGRK